MGWWEKRICTGIGDGLVGVGDGSGDWLVVVGDLKWEWRFVGAGDL